LSFFYGTTCNLKMANRRLILMFRQGAKVLAVFVAIAAFCWSQTGVVKSEGQPLPGATVRATQGGRVLTTLTGPDGKFKFDNRMTPGAWVIDVNMFGFEPIRREVQIGASPSTVDFTLQLRTNFGPPGRGGGFGGFGGRGGRTTEGGQAETGQPGGGRFAGGRSGFAPGAGGRAGAIAQTAENVAPADSGAVAAADSASGDTANVGVVNPPETPDAQAAPVNAAGANESFLVSGSLSTGIQTQAGDFAPGFGPGGFNGGGGAASGGLQTLPGQDGAPQVPTAATPGGAGGGGGGFTGRGFGGPPGGFGGGGGGRGGFGGRGGRGPGGRGGPPGGFIGNRRNAQQPRMRASVFYTGRSSEFDASPFSINGQNNTKASYAANRFGFNLAGPLGIPKLFQLDRTTLIFGYNGNLTSNGVNLTGTVPTLAERAGDFSALPTLIYNPATRLPFPGNRIDQINPIATGLLDFIPKPNQPGIVNNYRLVTANPSNAQAVGVRLSHLLSRTDQVAGNVNWQSRDSKSTQMFGFVDSSTNPFVNANANWRHNFGGGLFHNIALQFRRNTNLSTPFFAYGADVASMLGIQGTSSNPANFGPPNVSFTNSAALTDGSPSRNATYSYGFTDAVSWRLGKHNWSFGGGYTKSFNNTITDQNGRGSFTFTGLVTSEFDASGHAIPGTGLDFADFLLGAPQSNSIRFGSSSTYFRTYNWYAFAQDDWRVRSNLTLNLGLRYEFFAPWEEKYNRIANLDVAPGFAAVAQVTPGQAGPYSGVFPSGLLNPDRNNFGPRTALAWKPWNARSFVVRLGYGMYYNPGIYGQFTSRLAQQPPFAQSTTVTTSLTDPLTLATGLTVTPTGKTILNTFAVNRDYRTMYAQSWTAGIQTGLPGALVLELNYLGTKGTRLDIQESPNQAPPGSQLTSQDRLNINNATAFIYDTPIGNSIYHAAQVRVNRRFRRGFSSNVQYMFAKSIDNSSTLGGAGNTVAQNYFDLAAERGLSSFDRRHALTANYVWSPPIGDGDKWLARVPFLEKALANWTISGAITLQTGTPLTARVLGNQSDTAGVGTLGSSRAQATGLPIDNGSGYFNLVAFTTPPAGQFGDAGRNTIPGPGSFLMNLSVQRFVPLGERIRLQIRVDANNVTNHVNITNFGTIVNSVNYGVISGAGGMRNLSMTVRLNF